MARSVAIVGAGPAGMAAAIAAVELGASVTLIDEGARPGGQIYRQAAPTLSGKDVADAGERRRKARLLGEFEQIAPRIDYRPGCSAYAMFGKELHVAAGDRTEIVAADAVVLANGVREMAMPFPGWTTPGVMYAGGAQSLIKAQRVLPGRKVVVAGAGPLPVVVAAQILRAGGEVAALAALRPITSGARHLAGLWHGRAIVAEGLRYLATVVAARVPRLTGFVPLRVLGSECVEAVVLGRVAPKGGIVPGSETEIACDALVVNYGFAANSELVAMAGAQMRYDARIGGWLPKVDAFGRTSVPGVFAAGDMAGLRGALVAEAEGRLIGAAAASEPAALAKPGFARRWQDLIARRRRLGAFQQVVRAMLEPAAELWDLADDATIVCRCENVTLGDLQFAFAAGHLAPNTIKRSTRAAMGWCGGRTCMPMIAALAQRRAGAAPEQMMTPRPLARPVPFSALARQTKG